MQKSEQINELAQALSKTQAEIQGAVKDSSNPFFKSKYADLASVMAAIQKLFGASGLSYVQSTRIEASGTVILVTVLMHSSGQWVSGEYPVIGKDTTPQAFGSAMTYARRYTLAAMCGVAQIDDDGEAAMGRQGVPNKAFMKQDGSWAHGAQNPAKTPISKGTSPEDDFPAPGGARTYSDRRG